MNKVYRPTPYVSGSDSSSFILKEEDINKSPSFRRVRPGQPEASWWTSVYQRRTVVARSGPDLLIGGGLNKVSRWTLFIDLPRTYQAPIPPSIKEGISSPFASGGAAHP